MTFFSYGLGTTSNTSFSFNISNSYTIGSYYNSGLFMASLYIFGVHVSKLVLAVLETG